MSTQPVVIVISGDDDTTEVRPSTIDPRTVHVSFVDDRFRSVAHLDLSRTRAVDLRDQLTAALALAVTA